MAYNDLRDWIKALDKAGELKRVRAEVDPILEITEITDRVNTLPPSAKSAGGGPALLFENLKGYPGIQAADQPVRLGAAHEPGAGGRVAG